MTSGTKIENPTCLIDYCPTHGEDCKGEYDFGQMEVTLYTYECGCAVTYDVIKLSATIWDNYADAEGHARLITMRENIDNKAWR